MQKPFGAPIKDAWCIVLVLYVLDMDVTDWHDNLLQHIGMRVSAVTEGAGLDTGNADLRGDVMSILAQ